METKANTTLIGLFTLGVLGAFGLFLWWFLRVGDSSNREDFRVVFTGPVSGLRTGSAVFFNGIRKGEVRRIDIDPSDPRKVVAIIALQPGTPISTATRANLNVQLLSGIASLGLVNGPDPAQPLQRAAGGQPPQIGPDVPGGSDIMSGAQQTMNTLNGLVNRLDAVIAEGQGSFQQSLRNVEKFTAALGDNSDGVREFLGQTGEAAKQIAALAQRLDRVTTQIEG
jgi:phospholipid/cholesterol/gamma-HCH transport system substrate-binding protein